MRTKTLLLAAAAIAAGVASSMAQSNVYSVNIVGYINTPVVGAGKYTLVANPFDNGTNTLVSLVDAYLPNKSSVATWAGTSYATSTKSSSGWTANPTIAPGQGFFIKNGVLASPAVNVLFTGSAPTATTNNLPLGYSLVGSTIPFSGDVTTDTNINLFSVLANKSTVAKWNPVTQTFVTSTKSSTGWTVPQNIAAGEGFFINAKATATWTQKLY